MTAEPHRRRSILSRIVRRIIIFLYHLKGWKIDGVLPDIPKYVIAGAPHTSNWDFVFFLGATEDQGVHPNFMGKHTLFQGIMRNFMLDMGGIPIDRTKRANYVEQAAKVPIVAAWVCNERRVLGFSEPVWPSGDYGADLLKIANFLRSKLPELERYKVLEAQARKLLEQKSDNPSQQ